MQVPVTLPCSCAALASIPTMPRSLIWITTNLAPGFEAVAAISILFMYFLMKRRNATKQKLLSEGQTSTGMEGDRALDFMYAL